MMRNTTRLDLQSKYFTLVYFQIKIIYRLYRSEAFSQVHGFDNAHIPQLQ